jgi:hypothetical protein
MSNLLKNIFVICICIACAAIGYYLFFTTNDLDLVGGTDVELELINKTQSFIERSAKLQQIIIDQSLFTDSTFTSLRSFSTPVPNQPLGRVNIFSEAVGISQSPSAVTEE